MCTDDTVCKFGHPIWKCEVNCKTDSSLPRLKHGSKRCDSEYLHECSIFQSFMEKLYQIRNELYVYDEEALIVRDFYSSCMERAKNNNSFFYIDYCECDRQIKRVKNSIMEFAENQEELFEALGEEDFFDSLIVEYEAQLRELEKHKKELFYKLISSDMYYDRFRYFVDSVLTLPEIDPSEDVLIPFDKAFYLSFIESGRVLGDRISYKTKFGTSFDTVGNTRIMEEFISYQKECPDGNRITIKEAYQVYDYQLQYTKRKTG